MRLSRLVLCSLAAVISLSSLSLAGPFDVKQVPASAKWVLHIDADAVAGSQLWQMAQPMLGARPEFNAKVAELQRIAEMQFPKDLHSVTLFGTGFTERDATAVIRAKVNRERLRTLLSVNESFSADKHGEHEVLGWVDKGKQLYGSFAGGDAVVISQSKASVQAALDLIDGKDKGLATTSMLTPAGKASPGILLYVAGEGLAQLARAGAAQSPLAGQVDSAWITIAEQNENVVLRGSLAAKDAQTAEKVRKSIDGIQAIASLAADDPNAPAEKRAAAAAMQDLTVKTEGTTVTADWPIPLATVKELMNARAEKRAAGSTTAP
jgi:hypothetical protein